MSLIVRMRKQSAIYWAFVGTEVSPAWALPIPTKVRWEDKVLEKVVDPRHELARFRAEVYIGQDMTLGDYLMLGALSSSTPLDPRLTASYEVLGTEKTPNLRATEILRLATCAPSPLALIPLRPRGLEAITYNQMVQEPVQANGAVLVQQGNPQAQKVNLIAVPAALRGRPETMVKEVERFSSFQSGESMWEIPRVYVTEPSSEDYFLDNYGIRWNVVEWREGTLRSWWLVRAKRGSA